MNKVLERQLKKSFGSLESVPANIGDFIEAVNSTYDNSDQDRLLIERSLEISSREFRDLSMRLQTESTRLKAESEENQKSKLAVMNLLEDLEEEKKKVEAIVVVRTRQLQEEKARLTASINSLSFGFMIVNLDHSLLLKNRAVMDLFGYKDTDEVTVKKISEKLGGFDIEAEADRCLKGKTVCEIKEILFDKKILRGIVAPIMAEDMFDKKIGYVLLLDDITEARVMERSRDEFFALASHELRTPLTAIRGNSDMIMDSFGDKITDPDVREMLSDINESAIRLIQIVNDFLEVSRLEQGRFEIKSEPFDVSEVVTKVVRDLRGALEQKNVILKYVESTQSIPKAYGDKSRIEQVLINLIGNSLKFTKKGSITVSLEVSDQFVMVNVKDTGIGISEQNQARLFRKFQQAGESMLARDVTKGTGLGLYISQLLISSMGGSLGLVSSELGKGSTFAFTVPIVGAFPENK